MSQSDKTTGKKQFSTGLNGALVPDIKLSQKGAHVPTLSMPVSKPPAGEQTSSGNNGDGAAQSQANTQSSSKPE